jgi:hypothetical protein
MLNQSAHSCSTCKWWQRSAPKLAAALRDPSASEALGTCQVNPPVVVEAVTFPVTMFPETHGDRFCGRWRAAHRGGDGGGEAVVPFKQREAA